MKQVSLTVSNQDSRRPSVAYPLLIILMTGILMIEIIRGNLIFKNASKRFNFTSLIVDIAITIVQRK